MMMTLIQLLYETRCHAVAGRTARCRYKFRHNGIVHAVTLVHVHVIYNDYDQPTFLKIVMGFVAIEPINVHAKFEISSFSAS